MAATRYRPASLGVFCLALVASACYVSSLSPAKTIVGSNPAGVVGQRLGGMARNVAVGSFFGSSAGSEKRLLVLGGSGFVGRQVCKYAVEQGFKVTSLSRRGENPLPNDPSLQQVEWVQGNALEKDTVLSLVKDADAVVHAMGLLFDINSGLTNLNLVVSGSRSMPDSESTYDNITRKTAEILLQCIKSNNWMGSDMPVAFVSAAEAGWPDMKYGPEVEGIAPDWLKRYLSAKRSVEDLMSASTNSIRPIIYRPSLIWNWGKLDVLPIIPIFNLANALGVPFVDKTVRVETLAKAIVEGIKDNGVKGVQRFPEMESLAANI